jgi:hypothetical protein
MYLLGKKPVAAALAPLRAGGPPSAALDGLAGLGASLFDHLDLN